MKFIQQRSGDWTVFVYEIRDLHGGSKWCGYVRQETYPTDPSLLFITHRDSIEEAAQACLRFLRDQTEDIETLRLRVQQLLGPQPEHKTPMQIPLDLG